MKDTFFVLVASASLLASNAIAQAPQKTKVLDALNSIDPKTLEIRNAKGKIVSTPDPEHRQALELIIDYAKPDTCPGVFKKIAPGTLDLKKYSAIRFWVRSNVETSYYVTLRIDSKTWPPLRADGKCAFYSGITHKATGTWSQVVIPLENFKRQTRDLFKKGEKVTTPGGGETLDNQDINSPMLFGAESTINQSGTSTVGHLMFDALELVEK